MRFFEKNFLILGLLSTSYLNLILSNLDNQILRRIQVPEVDRENVERQLVHITTAGGEWIASVLRDFILNTPSTENLRDLKGIEGKRRENIIGEIIAGLIKEVHENEPEYFNNLSYALRYLSSNPITKEKTERILTIAKEISERGNIIPSFTLPYINKILKDAEEIHLLNEQEGKELTLRKIEEDPGKTFVSILDIDYLSLFNHAYGKSILNYVLEDIRRTVVVTLKEFSAFAYTNSGRDELWITLNNIKEESKAEEILRLINQNVADKRYIIIQLNSDTNSTISGLSPGEFKRLKQTLSHYGIGISNGEYIKGEYLLILPIYTQQTFPYRENAEDFLNKFFIDVNNYLKDDGFDIELGGNIFPFNGGFLPRITVSIGTCSLNPQNYEFDPGAEPGEAYRIALRRANIALREVKATEEKNDVRIYEEGMEEYEDGRKIFSEGFLQEAGDFFQFSEIPAEEQDPLCPNLYANSILREKIQTLITQGENGHLIWIEPQYYIKGEDDPLQFHMINELYSLEGGDLVIQALAYLLSKNLPLSLVNSALISRASPDGLLIFIPDENEELDSEQRTILAQLLDKIKSDFDSEAKTLNIYFDAAIANTKDISQVGELFAHTEYTYYSQEGAEIYPTALGNIIKIYTSQVEREIAEIQKKIQEDALNEMYLLFQTEGFDEGP